MLSIITHTKPGSGRDLTRCVESVKAALPRAGAQHLVIPCESELMEARWEARKISEFIAFVDDDDYISQDSIIKCMAALQVSGAGLAFTNEILVNPDDSVITRNDKDKSYEHIALTPLVVHHLCVMRTELITDDVKALADEHHCGVEWLMKAKCALTGGAVHVPIDGYYWVHHENQHHKQKEWQEAFVANINLITPKLKSWMKHTGPIPQYKVA